MRAHGSLDKGLLILSPRQKALRFAEMLLIYCGAPILITHAVHYYHIPLMLLLQPVLAILILWLWLDPTFSLGYEFTRPFSQRTLVKILATFIFIGGMLTAFTAYVWPEIFLSFPRENWERWQYVMLAYPVLSVVPQELVYRPLFFHRYGPLFDSRFNVAIVTNSLLFGFGHIMLLNPVAITFTAIISFLFARRYLRSGSVWAAWLEHSLYGCLIFTLGLGLYFYTGALRVN